jgi:6-phosphogluconolactonase/glucosamine-6-phosphate isomerase/deaminase
MKKVLFGPVTPDVPASALQLHPEATILVDASVAVFVPTASAASWPRRSCLA